MTHRLDVAHSRGVVARWCDLAEQRLEYLTELFETGRWRRFHSEVEFLENIQEAKSAVEIWRNLSTREASRVDMSVLGRARAALPRSEGQLEQLDRRPPQLVPIASAEPLRDASISAEPAHVVSDEAPSAPVMDPVAPDDGPPPTLDMIAQRYPLLRNAL
jgi:uncharacterized repeat protein (TIGR03809 family)